MSSKRLIITMILTMQLSAIVAFAADDKTSAAKGDVAKKLRVMVFGTHPDDPESGAGGLILQLTKAGHDVHVAYAVTYRQGRTYFDPPERDVRHLSKQSRVARCCRSS